MKFDSNKNLKAIAQDLRKNMTPHERKLWYEFLKGLPCTVRRQHVIDEYVVDFYCAKNKTVIELDGSQHYEDTGIASDAERDAYLKSHGYNILRYSNYEIDNNFSGVCLDIMIKLGLSQ